jgi:hypothetical protein
MESMAYSASQWMQLMAIGGMFGALGQAIRVIPGLKKVADEAAASGSRLKQEFSGGRLAVSLLIGAVAGVLGAISLSVPVDGEKIGSATIIALLGIGYSGADFIEAFMSRYGKAGGTPAATAAGVGTAPVTTPGDAAASSPAGTTGDAAPHAVG